MGQLLNSVFFPPAVALIVALIVGALITYVLFNQGPSDDDKQ